MAYDDHLVEGTAIDALALGLLHEFMRDEGFGLQRQLIRRRALAAPDAEAVEVQRGDAGLRRGLEEGIPLRVDREVPVQVAEAHAVQGDQQRARVLGGGQLGVEVVGLRRAWRKGGLEEDLAARCVRVMCGRPRGCKGVLV